VAKCHFFQEEVENLGHVTRPGRVHVLQKNLRALRGLRYPETQTQMKSFLGMCGVYRRFVADFAKIAKPLTAFVEHGSAISFVCTYPLEHWDSTRSGLCTAVHR